MGPGRRSSIVIRGLAACLCILALSAPVTAQSSVSEEDELAVGRAVAAELISRYDVFADVEWQGFLTPIRDRLVPVSGRPNIPHTLIILDTAGPKSLSPPGYIFLPRGRRRLGAAA